MKTKQDATDDIKWHRELPGHILDVIGQAYELGIGMSFIRLSNGGIEMKLDGNENAMAVNIIYYPDQIESSILKSEWREIEDRLNRAQYLKEQEEKRRLLVNCAKEKLTAEEYSALVETIKGPDNDKGYPYS